MSKTKLNEYALYDGDDFIDIGTVPELSEKYNIPKRYLYFYSSPTALKRDKGSSKILVKVN